MAPNDVREGTGRMTFLLGDGLAFSRMRPVFGDFGWRSGAVVARFGLSPLAGASGFCGPLFGEVVGGRVAFGAFLWGLVSLLGISAGRLCLWKLDLGFRLRLC
jgi:hypothetical protein